MRSFKFATEERNETCCKNPDLFYIIDTCNGKTYEDVWNEFPDVDVKYNRISNETEILYKLKTVNRIVGKLNYFLNATICLSCGWCDASNDYELYKKKVAEQIKGYEYNCVLKKRKEIKENNRRKIALRMYSDSCKQKGDKHV